MEKVKYSVVDGGWFCKIECFYATRTYRNDKTGARYILQLSQYFCIFANQHTLYGHHF